MRELTACGVLCFYNDAFLLMQRGKRFDLPKGHMAPGETELQTALREVTEETGIQPHQIDIDPDFRYSVTYFPVYEKYDNELIEKTAVFFVGYLREAVEIELTEHTSFEWVPWNPPHIIQRETINGLLAAVEQHFATRGRPSQWQQSTDS